MTSNANSSSNNMNINQQHHEGVSLPIFDHIHSQTPSDLHSMSGASGVSMGVGLGAGGIPHPADLFSSHSAGVGDLLGGQSLSLSLGGQVAGLHSVHGGHPSLSPSLPQSGNDPSDPQPSKASINILTSMEGKTQKILMTINTNLFKAASGNRLSISPALSKPSFCPVSSSGDTSHFVCGTEEQDPFKRTQNQLIFASIDHQTSPTSTVDISNASLSVRFVYPITDYVRDIWWIDANHIVFAINQKLGLIRMTPEVTVEDIVMFPEFHKDTIREIAVNTAGNRDLVISGGFDGNVFVTDISRLVTDIQKNEKKSENSLYPCRDVVSSVSWHVDDPFLASCTTDTGTLHIFDIRTDKRRPAIVYDTAKKELFCHAYRDGSVVLLGFGDGTIQLFDSRNKRAFLSFVDPNVTQIGEIRFDYQTKNFAVFGIPEFTLWNYDDSNFSLATHHQLADQSMMNSVTYYKTSGDFRKGHKNLGVTDSCGTFSLYDFNC